MDFKATNKYTVTNHKETLHETLTSCENCEFVTDQKETLTIHMKENHNFSCDQCDIHFVTRNSLDLHVKEHVKQHQISNNNCDYCENTFAKNEDLKSHLKRIHKVDSHSCNYCDYKAIEKISLKYHIKLTHQDISCIKCIECKPTKKIESKEMFECIDCEECCCQPCKDSIRYENKAKEMFKLTLEQHQFICKRCLTKRVEKRRENKVQT